VFVKLKNFDLDEDIDLILPQESDMMNIYELAGDILRHLQQHKFIYLYDLIHMYQLLSTLQNECSVNVDVVHEDEDAIIQQINNQINDHFKHDKVIVKTEDHLVQHNEEVIRLEDHFEHDKIMIKAEGEDLKHDEDDIGDNFEHNDIHMNGEVIKNNENHKQVVTNDVKSKQNKRTKKSRKGENIKVAKPKIDAHICEYCKTVFNNKVSLDVHVRIHTGEMPYLCTLCGKSYRQQANLQRHITIDHEKAKNFSCSLCRKSFGYKSVLNEHMRVHSGEKPFQCRICDQRFTQRSNMNKHIKLNHLEAKDFSCDICDKSFVASYYLKRHKSMVHKVDVSKKGDGEDKSRNNFRCPYCKEAVFVESTENLEQHLAIFHRDQIQSNQSFVVIDTKDFD